MDLWRRGWDSNPRTPVKMLLEFQSSAFDRSATSPFNMLRNFLNFKSILAAHPGSGALRMHIVSEPPPAPLARRCLPSTAQIRGRRRQARRLGGSGRVRCRQIRDLDRVAGIGRIEALGGLEQWNAGHLGGQYGLA